MGKLGDGTVEVDDADQRMMCLKPEITVVLFDGICLYDIYGISHNSINVFIVRWRSRLSTGFVIEAYRVLICSVSAPCLFRICSISAPYQLHICSVVIPCRYTRRIYVTILYLICRKYGFGKLPVLPRAFLFQSHTFSLIIKASEDKIYGSGTFIRNSGTLLIITLKRLQQKM